MQLDPQEELFRPKPDLLGAVAEIEDDHLLLTDNVGEDRVPISDVWLEPRHEHLEAVVHALYPRDAQRILTRLKALRTDQTTAKGRLERVQQILEGLKATHTATTGDGLTPQLSDLLTP